MTYHYFSTWLKMTFLTPQTATVEWQGRPYSQVSFRDIRICTYPEVQIYGRSSGDDENNNEFSCRWWILNKFSFSIYKT